MVYGANVLGSQCMLILLWPCIHFANQKTLAGKASVKVIKKEMAQKVNNEEYIKTKERDTLRGKSETEREENDKKERDRVRKKEQIITHFVWLLFSSVKMYHNNVHTHTEEAEREMKPFSSSLWIILRH